MLQIVVLTLVPSRTGDAVFNFIIHVSVTWISDGPEHTQLTTDVPSGFRSFLVNMEKVLWFVFQSLRKPFHGLCTYKVGIF